MLRSLCEEMDRLVLQDPSGHVEQLQRSPLFQRAVLQLTSTEVEVGILVARSTALVFQ